MEIKKSVRLDYSWNEAVTTKPVHIPPKNNICLPMESKNLVSVSGTLGSTLDRRLNFKVENSDYNRPPQTALGSVSLPLTLELSKVVKFMPAFLKSRVKIILSGKETIFDSGTPIEVDIDRHRAKIGNFMIKISDADIECEAA